MEDRVPTGDANRHKVGVEGRIFAPREISDPRPSGSGIRLVAI